MVDRPGRMGCATGACPGEPNPQSRVDLVGNYFASLYRSVRFPNHRLDSNRTSTETRRTALPTYGPIQIGY